MKSDLIDLRLVAVRNGLSYLMNNYSETNSLRLTNYILLSCGQTMVYIPITPQKTPYIPKQRLR